jgi:hypothetical protein
MKAARARCAAATKARADNYQDLMREQKETEEMIAQEAERDAKRKNSKKIVIQQDQQGINALAITHYMLFILGDMLQWVAQGVIFFLSRDLEFLELVLVILGSIKVKTNMILIWMIKMMNLRTLVTLILFLLPHQVQFQLRLTMIYRQSGLRGFAFTLALILQ